MPVLLCAAIFFLIIGLCRFAGKGPEGEYITLEEANNLTWLLADTAEVPVPYPDGDTAYLTASQWKQILSGFPLCAYEIPDYYRSQDHVLLEDWYTFYDGARKIYDTENRIQDNQISILGIGEQVTSSDGTALSSQQLLTENGVYSFRTERIPDYLFQNVSVIQRDGILFAVRNIVEDELALSGVWLMGENRIFLNDWEILIPDERLETSEPDKEKEQVADLFFQKGKLTAAEILKEKVSGKLLKVTADGIELEGQEFLPFAENFCAYRIYGTLKTYEKSELKIGYDFTDFVVKDGTVRAALVVREENMENIRVLIRTDDYAGYYHDALDICADCDLTVTAGAGSQTEHSVLWPAGETLRIETGSELFDAGTVRLEPAVNTGRISLLNLSRNQGTPEYRGLLELEQQEEGITVVNEVLLEEYLYSVVPSEMPASYPLEALKAQAICARTYAYQKMLQAGLANFGAHVDDSSAFQVYNNIAEQTETTRAVRETQGELLCYGEELAQTYYYSTSCGYGSNVSVWSDTDPEAYPYLQAKAVNRAGITDAQGDTAESQVQLAEIADAVRMQAAEDFSAFIRGRRETDFESENVWYRWTYHVEQPDAERIFSMLQKRYAANPALILTRTENRYESLEPADPGRIVSLEVLSRQEGGAAQELLIEGEDVSFLVKTEYNIRAVLNDGETKVIRQDGSEYLSSSLLPSAFFDLEAEYDSDGYLAGFTLYGGGFGHGVGMSQNGACSMAQSGCDADTILGFFFEGSSIRTIY